MVKISNEAEYEQTIEMVEKLWDSREGTAEHAALMRLLDLIHEYEGSGGDPLDPITDLGEGVRERSLRA